MPWQSHENLIKPPRSRLEGKQLLWQYEKMITPPRSVLLFRLGGLGDLLITLPSIAYVRKKFPADKLTLVGRAEYGALFRDAGTVDEILSWDAPEFADLFKEDPRPRSSLAQRLRRFRLVLGWFHKPPGSDLCQNLGSLGRLDSHLIIRDPSTFLSLSEYFYAKTAAILKADGKPACSFEECARLPIQPGPRKLKTARTQVIIHPGSGSESKCWPLANFLDLIGRLSAKGIPGILVTGEAEERLMGALEKTQLPQGWRWLPNPPLTALARMLADSSLYIGNDSGVTHLAAACGTRVVALFRKDLEALWRPFGQNHRISADSLASISTESVWSAVSHLSR